MTRLEVKNKQQQDTCSNEIGICALNMYIILSAIFNTLGRTCVIVQRQRIVMTLNSTLQMMIFMIQNC